MKLKIVGWTVAGLLMCLAAGVSYIELCLVDSRPDKLWVHRCNSLEKLHEMSQRYTNFEFDVCFRPDGTLDVTHDEDTTFHLSAEPYFQFLQQHPESHLWMDVKNLNERNQMALLGAIDSLANRYGIAPNRLIVESRQWRLLAPLTQKGYETSCYVDVDKPSRLDEAGQDSLIALLQGVADSHQVRAISFAWWWYTTLRERLNRPNIDLLTWRHRDTQLEFFLTPSGYRMLDDPQLKVILIKDKGHYHR